MKEDVFVVKVITLIHIKEILWGPNNLVYKLKGGNSF